MGERTLAILEVSRKQAYIFADNKLRSNILRSAQIAWVTSPGFFCEVCGSGELFREEDNFVYAGGGHTVLEFSSRDKARSFIRLISFRVHEYFPEMELFAATWVYKENFTPAENLKRLTETLERKKALRRAAFHQGSFGVEQINATTLDVMRISDPGEAERERTLRAREEELERSLLPEGYTPVTQFADIGNSEDSSSFIAIVHLDGNAMGARVARFYEKHGTEPWNVFKKTIREFSDCIDRDYKNAYRMMTAEISRQIGLGVLADLDLKDGFFPVRRIITSGDDICFVAEGRIGIEAAAVFLNALGSICNAQDGEAYSGCAGIAIVHQKYPFFRAYELAESLCANAKKFGAQLGKITDTDPGAVCAVDWHIEHAEIGDSLEEIREEYLTRDGVHLELRPLIVRAPEEILAAEKFRRYEAFKKLVTMVRKAGDDDVRSKLKQMRGPLRQGEKAAEYFIRFHKLDELTVDTYQDIFEAPDLSRIGTGQGQEGRIFLETADGEKRSVVFDAAEIMDTFIPFAEGGESV